MSYKTVSTYGQPEGRNLILMPPVSLLTRGKIDTPLVVSLQNFPADWTKERISCLRHLICIEYGCRQWRRSQVKSGEINIEKIEGVGSGEGLCPPSWGSGGLPQKNNFALKIMQFWASFGTSFLYYNRKLGGLSPSPESGGTYPPVPPSPTPMDVI